MILRYGRANACGMDLDLVVPASSEHGSSTTYLVYIFRSRLGSRMMDKSVTAHLQCPIRQNLQESHGTWNTVISLIASIAIHTGVSSKVVRHEESDGRPNGDVLLDA